MTIQHLKMRLNQYTENTSNDQRKFVQPRRLIATLKVIEERFDSLESSVPQEIKLIKSIERVLKDGFDNLSRRDLKNLAWALSKVSPLHNQKLLFTNLGQKILNYFEKSDIDLIRVIYFPALYSYFAFNRDDVQNKPAVWFQLRGFLNAHRIAVYHQANRPKVWMNTLSDHADLLSLNPTKAYLNKFFDESDATINPLSEQLGSLHISANSWFWSELVEQAISSIASRNDKEFFNLIDQCLNFAEKNSIYLNQILKVLLERYETSSNKSLVHERLKQTSLKHWQNPQYSSSAGWNNVNAQTKQMVIQWFVRDDLEAFFKVFSHGADIRRFNYWMSFLKKVTLSQIFLNNDSVLNPTGQQKEFIEKNKGRLKRVIGKSSAANAFMIRIGAYYIVEFSEQNNATYFYRNLPYQNSKEPFQKVDIQYLKSTTRADFYLIHNGTWEKNFDRRLAELGIFPHGS